MKELELKYGCNPNQKPAKIFMNDNKDLPVTVLSGRPGYIKKQPDFRQQLLLNMFHLQVQQ